MASLADAKTAPLGHGDEKPYENWGALASLVAQTAFNSPYLSKLIGREGEWILARKDVPANQVFLDIITDIDDSDIRALEKSLRIAKNRVALYLALLDLGGVLPLLEVTRYLTEFADLSVQKSLHAYLKLAVEKNKLPQEVLSLQGGLFVLAMGKGGASELNYSSDIDLILFYDAKRFLGFEGDYDFRKEFIRAAQGMVKLLSEATSEGYVFRADLRLRPDPSVTPVVISTDQALGYYELLGRTWERAAFIKARVCAGDIEAGEEFLSELRPFVWRKHLDFAAIEDAHNMRLRIREHKGLEGAIHLEGHNLKLGRGGIREIEFFTQTRQLIFGGRNEALRIRPTCEALQALAHFEIIEPELAEYLKGEYLWLRKLEHIAQMIDDRQTHDVPTGEKLQAFLNLAGAAHREEFEAEFVLRLQKIDETMERFFAGTRSEVPPENYDFGGDEGDILEGWMSLPALRSERSRAIFARLKPQILSKLGASMRPKDALINFDRFLRQLPSGVQLLSLFEANPLLLDLLVEICSLAPSEAKTLGENHRIFEAVLSRDFFQPLICDEYSREILQERLARELADAEDYEDVLNGVRRFVKEAQFRVSVHLLRDLASTRMIGEAYSQIADVALDALYPAVLADMERRYGKAPGRGMVVLAMGKLGSREMTRTSDLDLVMIYDAGGEDYSDGKRPLASSQYFSRFTQNFIQAITVATAEGALFEVDTRLRPSGRGGPVAVSLASFAAYQMDEAWTWEHMALLRARVVAGEATLADDVMKAASAALKKPREKLKIAQDVLEMRARIRDNFSDTNSLSLKHGEGRMMETELMLQGFALMKPVEHAGHSMYELWQASCDILEKDEFEAIGKAMEVNAGLLQLARLSFAGEMPSVLPDAWLARQSVLTSQNTQAELETFLDAQAEKMNQIFNRYYEVANEP